MKYSFSSVSVCNMCGAPAAAFRVVGLRMNRSQGFQPKKVDGIAVSIKRCVQCGLIFADPCPVPDQLSDHYGIPPEEYWKDDSIMFGTKIILRTK